MIGFAVSALCFSGAAIVYAAVIYPFLSAILARRKRRKTFVDPATWPSVALFVTARNEENSLRDRLENLLVLDYPDLEIIVVSDGSVDGTIDIAQSYTDRGIKLVRTSKVGKTAAIQAAVKQHRTAQVFAFTDATSHWPPESLKRLIRPFTDPSTGAVSGQVGYVYSETPIGRGFRWYHNNVLKARRNDAKWGSATSISGSISAIRAAHWQVIPAVVDNDIALPCIVAEAGKVVVIEPTAISHETARSKSGAEYRSRKRQALFAYTFMGWVLDRLHALPSTYVFQIVSAKFMRWLMPLFILMMVLSTCVLVALRPEYGWLLAVEMLPFGLGALGWGPGKFALTVGTAYIVAAFQFVSGQRVTTGWDPADQR